MAQMWMWCLLVLSCCYTVVALPNIPGRFARHATSTSSNTSASIATSATEETTAADSDPTSTFIRGSECQFPFIYKNVSYSECTTIDDPNGQLWCSTGTDDHNHHIKGNWKHCRRFGNVTVISTHLLDEDTTGRSAGSDLIEEEKLCGVSVNRLLAGRISYFEDIDVKEHKNLAKEGEYPWQVAILSRDMEYRCGGVVVGKRNVITVAHCVADVVASDILVRVGDFDLSTDDEQYPSYDIAVRCIRIHPDFGAAKLQNDLAILEVKFNLYRLNNVAPACLPTPGFFSDVSDCKVPGWGQFETSLVNLGSDKFTYAMMVASLKTIPSTECQTIFRASRKVGSFFKLQKGNICAIGNDGDDTCHGDGGSGLICPNDRQQYVVEGLVSWGIGCGLELPGAYVDLRFYLGWIMEEIESQCPQSLHATNTVYTQTDGNLNQITEVAPQNTVIQQFDSQATTIGVTRTRTLESTLTVLSYNPLFQYLESQDSRYSSSLIPTVPGSILASLPSQPNIELLNFSQRPTLLNYFTPSASRTSGVSTSVGANILSTYTTTQTTVVTVASQISAISTTNIITQTSVVTQTNIVTVAVPQIPGGYFTTTTETQTVITQTNLVTVGVSVPQAPYSTVLTQTTLVTVFDAPQIPIPPTTTVLTQTNVVTQTNLVTVGVSVPQTPEAPYSTVLTQTTLVTVYDAPQIPTPPTTTILTQTTLVTQTNILTQTNLVTVDVSASQIPDVPTSNVETQTTLVTIYDAQVPHRSTTTIVTRTNVVTQTNLVTVEIAVPPIGSPTTVLSHEEASILTPGSGALPLPPKPIAGSLPLPPKPSAGSPYSPNSGFLPIPGTGYHHHPQHHFDKGSHHYLDTGSHYHPGASFPHLKPGIGSLYLHPGLDKNHGVRPGPNTNYGPPISVKLPNPRKDYGPPIPFHPPVTANSLPTPVHVAVTEYGPPVPIHPPVAEYGPPVPKHPVTEYGPPIPKHPVAEYGPPIPKHPVAEYGAPIPKHPVAEYGPPIPKQPVTEYGPPISKHPATEYGPPIPKHPVTEYGPPIPKHPVTEYGPPIPVHPPVAEYGPPIPVYA